MKKRIMSLLLAGIIAAGTVAGVSADDAAAAKGIKFKADSDYKANLYTHYLEGVEIGDTAGDILGALENSNGVEILRYNGDSATSLTGDEQVQYGDVLTLSPLTAPEGLVVCYATVAYVGDANMDSKLNINDVTIALKSIAKWGDLAIDASLTDVNGDGSITVNDVTLLLKKIAKYDVSFVKSPVLPGKGNMATNLNLNTYSSFYDEGAYSMPLNLRKGQDLAMKFSVPANKVAKSVKMVSPSWADNKGEIRLSIYKWTTDYETTVASDPIVTEKYVNYDDCAELVFNLCDTAGKGIGSGEYLFRVHEGLDTRVNPDDANEPVGVGVWQAKCPVATTGMVAFFEGVAMDPADPDSFGFVANICLGN